MFDSQNLVTSTQPQRQSGEVFHFQPPRTQFLERSTARSSAEFHDNQILYSFQETDDMADEERPSVLPALIAIGIAVAVLTIAFLIAAVLNCRKARKERKLRGLSDRQLLDMLEYEIMRFKRVGSIGSVYRHDSEHQG